MQYIIAVLLLLPVLGWAAEPIVESFASWSKPSFAGGSTFSNSASGVWYTENSVVRGDNQHDRGHAVRLNRSGTPPFLEYRGPVGQGLYGGIEAVSFDVAHWNGGASSVRFQLQASTNGSNWVNLGDEVAVRQIPFFRHEWSGLVLEEPLFLRVLATMYNERLLIRNFEIQPFVGARLHVESHDVTVAVQEKTLTLPIWIDPPAAATLDLAVVDGGDWAGELFTLISTQLVFSVEAPTQAVVLAVSDPIEAVPDPLVTLEMTAAAGATLPPDPFIRLQFLDQQLPRATLHSPAESLLESGDPLPLKIQLDGSGDAIVQIEMAGDAAPGVDYTLSSTQLVFQADGAVEQTVWLTPIDNTIGDGDRLIELSLVAIEGANPGDPSVLTILLLDDEPVARFVERASWTEVGQAIEITIELDHANDAEVQIEVVTEAVAGVDYELSATQLVFTASGPTAQTVTFTPLDRGMAAPPFGVELRLTGNQGFRPSEPVAHHVGVRSQLGLVVMAANLTSGGLQYYEEPGMRILRGLMPDVVGIQEFRVHGTRRAFVDEVFGPDYHYVVEAGAGLPCGIISRWPITEWGVWQDSVVGNRNFVWAKIDVPHLPRPLQIVSAHFYASGTASDRNQQALTMVQRMNADFHPADYTVVAADLNTQNRSESALATLAAWVSDEIQPADQLGNRNTNQNRIRPYDYVLVSPTLETRHRPMVVGARVFPNGMVFDSRLWSDPPHPIESSDSGALDMQHMAVVKFFEASTESLAYTRRLEVLESGNAVQMLERDGLYDLSLEWGMEGTGVVQNLTLELASLSPHLVLAPCLVDVGAVGRGMFTNAIPCQLQVPDTAVNGLHPVEIIFRSDAGTWTNRVEIHVRHDFINEAVDTSGWTWAHQGDWFLQTNVTSDGVSALMIEGDGLPADAWAAVIETHIEGPGRIFFNWWLNDSSWTYSHELYFSTPTGSSRWKNEGGWSSVEAHVASAAGPLRWTYYNFGSRPNPGQAVIDQIRFEPYTQAVLNVVSDYSTYHVTVDSHVTPDPQRIFVQNLEESPLHYVFRSDCPWVSIPEPRRIVQGPWARGHDYVIDFSELAVGVHTARLEFVAADAENGEQEVLRRVYVHPPLTPLPEAFLKTSSGGVHGTWRMTNRAEFGVAPVLRSGMASSSRPSWLIADVAGPGEVSFLWRKEIDWAEIELFLNGELIASLDAQSEWQPVTVALPPGTHRLEWRHTSWFPWEGSVTWIAHLDYVGEPDRDGDGLPDWWEILYFDDPEGADPMVDADSDGFTNWEEFVADTNPRDSNSFFRARTEIVHDFGPAVVLSDTLTNRVYGLYGSPALAPAAWTLMEERPGTGGPLIFPLTNDPSAMFLRGSVRMLPVEE